MSSWRVIRKLGEGGMGEVYLAQTPEGEEVAVKTLAESQRYNLPLFEQEAKLLTKLRHPAIASVLGYTVKSEEIFGEDKGPCFWMEYVEGEDLLSASQNVGASADNSWRTPEHVFNWLKQSLEALQYLHGQSILHGDLSPRNVLVDKTGQLKLLDFGLATSFLGSAKFNAGTLPYLAPERVYGKNLPASDLFSIGTLFYEALSGTHPRANCRSLQEMIRTEAKPLAEIAPALAPGFGLQARVIDRMIQTDLKNRFSAAGEVLAALAGGTATEATEETADYYPARMFGAEDDLKRTGERLKNLREQSCTIFLHGITGVGKRRFLSELRFQCALLGIISHEVSHRYIRPVLQSLKSEPFDGTHGFFFSNLEDLSFSELALLLSAFRGQPQKGILLLFHWNDDALSEEKKHFFENLVKTPGSEEIALKNLNPDETKALLEEALSLETAGEVGEALFNQTLGNPLLLLECVRMLRARQIATKKHFSKDWLEGLVNLHSFEDILLQRLESLEGREKEVLLQVAAAGEAVGYESLSHLIARPPSPQPSPSRERVSVRTGEGDSEVQSLKTHLDNLVSRNLIIQDSDTHRYRLSIPSLEGALIQKTPIEDMERIHIRWLAVLKDEKSDHSQKLHHALFLREKEIVQEGARPVAEAYRTQGDRSAALRIVNDALQMVDDPIETSQLLRLKVNLLNELGRFQEALIVCDDIYNLAATDETQALKTIKYYFITGLIHQNLGKPEESAPLLKRCLEEAKNNPHPSHIPFQTRAHTLLGIQEMNNGRLTEAVLHFEEALKTVGDLSVLKAEILRNMAIIRSEQGQWKEGQSLLHEARRLYSEGKYLQGELSSLVQEGNLALANHEPDTAETAYREAEKIAEANDEEMFLASVWNNLGVLSRRRGDLAQALNLLGKAGEIYRPLGKLNDLSENLAQSALAELSVGHFQRAQDFIEELEKYADRYPRARDLAHEARDFLSELKEGTLKPLEEPRPPDPLEHFWNRELALRFLVREGKKDQAIVEILKQFYEKLPLTLKVSFEERADYRKWVLKK